MHGDIQYSLVYMHVCACVQILYPVLFKLGKPMRETLVAVPLIFDGMNTQGPHVQIKRYREPGDNVHVWRSFSLEMIAKEHKQPWAG